MSAPLLPVGSGAGDVVDGAALCELPVWLPEELASLAEEVGVTGVLEEPELPELAIAAALNAAAVCSPVVGGFTENTMPDLQSDPTDEKNLRGDVIDRDNNKLLRSYHSG